MHNMPTLGDDMHTSEFVPSLELQSPAISPKGATLNSQGRQPLVTPRP